jgi:hypothetical protein
MHEQVYVVGKKIQGIYGSWRRTTVLAITPHMKTQEHAQLTGRWRWSLEDHLSSGGGLGAELQQKLRV